MSLFLLKPLFLMFFLFILGKAGCHKKKEKAVVGDLMEVLEFQKLFQLSNKKNKLYRVPKYIFMHQIAPYIISQPSVYAERILKQIFGDGGKIHDENSDEIYDDTVMRFMMNSCEYQSKKKIVMHAVKKSSYSRVRVPIRLLNVSKHIQCAQIKIEFPWPDCMFHIRTTMPSGNGHTTRFHSPLHFNFVRTKGWFVFVRENYTFFNYTFCGFVQLHKVWGATTEPFFTWSGWTFKSDVKFNITATFEKLEFVKE